MALNVKVKGDEIAKFIAEEIVDMKRQPWCVTTGILLGRYKGLEFKLLVTRDEDEMMGADCNKKLISVKESK